MPRTGIEPAPLALEAQSLNHWTAREVLAKEYLIGDIHSQTNRRLGTGFQVNLDGLRKTNVMSFQHKDIEKGFLCIVSFLMY